MIALVDACVLIDVLRGHPAASAALKRPDELAASEVTRYEVLAGALPGEEARIEEILGFSYWVPVLEGVTRRAAALYRKHNPAHSGIGMGDYLVAATALEVDLPLLTRNVRHFPMLPGLEPAY